MKISHDTRRSILHKLQASQPWTSRNHYQEYWKSYCSPSSNKFSPVG